MFGLFNNVYKMHAFLDTMTTGIRYKQSMLHRCGNLVYILWDTTVANRCSKNSLKNAVY